MTVPTIHMNGTSKEMLLKALEEAYSKLGEAYDALRQTTPHGRDYYVNTQPGNDLYAATNEHRARLAKIDSVRDELAQLAEAIQKQGN